MLRTLLLEGLNLFRSARSVLLPPSCRFRPSCSEFAAQALERHPAGRAVFLTAKRLLRCHPWHPGGWDPVP